MPLLDYVLLTLVCSSLAVLGDLIESFIKRCANQKDGGTILQSHGGVSDRLDSLILVLPFLYWYCLEYMSYAHSPNYDFDNVHILQFLKLRMQ
jgi:CDP-diglyceride synthetase